MRYFGVSLITVVFSVCSVHLRFLHSFVHVFFILVIFSAILFYCDVNYMILMIAVLWHWLPSDFCSCSLVICVAARFYSAGRIFGSNWILSP